ncbi:armadillo repeat-containing protein 8, partial [Dorcoceras hygrometricum]
LSDLSSKLECCRDRVLHLKVFDFAIDALLKNIFCSVKNLSAGHFMSEIVVLTLVQILCDSCMSVQIAISNVVVDLKLHKSLFTQSKGVKNRCKEEILLELTTSTLASLISDPEAAVQEQALALSCNLISGTLNSIEYVVGEYISFSWILLLQVLLIAACKFSLVNSRPPQVFLSFLCAACVILHCTGDPSPFPSSHLCALHFNQTPSLHPFLCIFNFMLVVCVEDCCRSV